MSRLMAGILFCIAIAAYVPAAHAQFNILPTPRHVTQGQGAFELRDSDVIAAPADARAQWIAGFLRDALHEQTGVDLQVVPAPERGRISLRIDPAMLVPGYGIYAGAVGDRRAAISIGVNPHYGGTERRVEAYLLDWEGDLYGRRLVVELWKRLRDERAFDSEADLVEQIARDVAETRGAERPV